MSINILMPALSPTMESGTLSKWLKKEGDPVKSGDVIAEIETDKATMEVEAVDEGTIGKILVAEGTAEVPVNQPIAILLEEGEDASAVDSAPAPAAAPQAAPKSAPKEEAKSEEKPAEPAPALKAEAAPAPQASKPAPAPAPQGDGKRIFASPLARRIAKDRGIELSQVKGSGPHGRVVKADVEGFTPGAAASAGQAAGKFGFPLMPDETIRALFAEGSYDVVSHTSMRRTIATRMQESKVVVPHYYLAVDVDLDRLMEVREELNAGAPVEDGKPIWRLSVNDFIIKALALTLKKHPEANATWTETGMLMHHNVDIGVAVAMPDGLITPILRKAEEKSLPEISTEMSELARRARDKRLKPMEYQGGTTAISNLGMYGVKHFTAVVNPPHSTILAVSAGEKRAVVRDNQIVIATQMTVTISCDHRVLDGAQSAMMMQTFKRYIEKPLSLFL